MPAAVTDARPRSARRSAQGARLRFDRY